jgi:hypothetical protein
MIGIIGLERGMPSKHKSLTCVDYVPALCTHRPSLLPIEWCDEHVRVCSRGVSNSSPYKQRHVNFTI